MDLTYVTPRILLVGASTPLGQTIAYIQKKHAGHYKVFDIFQFNGDDGVIVDATFETTQQYSINRYNVPAMESILKFCNVVDSYLQLSPTNVVILYSSVNDGRIILLASILLLHTGISDSAIDSADRVCSSRILSFVLSKINLIVTPTQLRYIYYYEQLLRKDYLIEYTMCITHIKITTIPNFDASIIASGCTPYIVVSLLKHDDDLLNWKPYCLYNQSGAVKPFPAITKSSSKYKTAEVTKTLRHYTKDDNVIDFDLTKNEPLLVRGDIVVSIFTEDTKMFQITFHSAFVEGNYLLFDKSAVDMASSDIYNRFFDPNFKVEIYLNRVEDKPSLNGAGSAVTSNSDIDCTIIDELFIDKACAHTTHDVKLFSPSEYVKPTPKQNSNGAQPTAV